jgi:type IV secretory pathway VirB9-like protein
MRYWDFIDFVIVAFYAFAGIAAGIAFFNGHELLDVAIVGFAVAGFGVTLAMILSAIDKALRNHYGR